MVVCDIKVAMYVVGETYCITNTVFISYINNVLNVHIWFLEITLCRYTKVCMYVDVCVCPEAINN